MNEIDLLDKLFKAMDQLNMSALSYGVDQNVVRMKIWSLRECRIIRKHLLSLGWQEITIRQCSVGWQMTADWPAAVPVKAR